MIITCRERCFIHVKNPRFGIPPIDRTQIVNSWLAQLVNGIFNSICYTLSQPADNNQLPLTNRKQATIISRNIISLLQLVQATSHKVLPTRYKQITLDHLEMEYRSIKIISWEQNIIVVVICWRPQVVFFCSIDPNTHRIAVTCVSHRDANTLIPIILTTTLPGVTTYSDQWTAYNSLAAQGYPHFTVNHTAIGDIHRELIVNLHHWIFDTKKSFLWKKR